jgi:integrase/recombinase XerD
MELPKVTAVLFTGKRYKDGTHPILIRISNNRKHTYKKAGFSVTSDAWDSNTRRVYEKKPQISKKQMEYLTAEKAAALKTKYRDAIVLSNAKHINSVIDNLIASINTLNQKLQVNDESLSVKNIKSKLTPRSQTQNRNSFFTKGNSIEDRFRRSNSISTAKRYRMVLKKLNGYTKGRDLKFEDITVDFLAEYEVFLKSEGYMINTVHNHLKTIKAIFFAALKEGMVQPSQNPFFIFKLKMDTKTKKEKLSLEEIRAIEGLNLEVKSLIWDVRNCFLFSFYCAGIRISDVLQLKWANITKDGRLEYQMEKTRKQRSIPLTPRALNIIKAYTNKANKPSQYIFPFIPYDVDKKSLFNQISSKTALANKYLKKIAALAEIDKPITTHIARHSFSDIARKRKANLYDLSKLLGHSSLRVTEIYLATLDLDSQDETLKSIMDY